MFNKQSRQLTEIQETIVLIRKGIEIPESELEKVRLSPELIRNEDSEEPEVRGKNMHIKRQLYGSQEVAVKKIRIPEGGNENRKSIEKYVFLMSKLSHCNSIEKFYGTLLINHELHIVTEWIERATLRTSSEAIKNSYGRAGLILRNKLPMLWSLSIAPKSIIMT